MLINLSIKIVDSCVDLALNKRSDLIFSRRKSASPEKIVYSIRLPKLDNFKFKIPLYTIEENITDLVFPVHVPYSEVFPAPFTGGGRIRVTPGTPYNPSFKNEAEKAMYQVCQSIWSENKLKEHFLRPRSVKSIAEAPRGRSSKVEKPTRKAVLDQACIEWAARDSHGYLGRYTRQEFLEDFQEKTGELITKDEFRRALEDALARGIIVKVKGRFRPKSSP